MPNLLPLGYENEIITPDDIVSQRPIGYRNGVAFDYEETGDFKRDGRNRLIDSDGIESWKSWIINCMETERYKFLAYGPDFGIELEKAFAARSHEEAEAILTREITEAIMADEYGRCAYIESIEYDWTEPDGVRVYAVLHGIDDVTIDVTAYITKGRET